MKGRIYKALIAAVFLLSSANALADAGCPAGEAGKPLPEIKIPIELPKESIKSNVNQEETPAVEPETATETKTDTKKETKQGFKALFKHKDKHEIKKEQKAETKEETKPEAKQKACRKVKSEPKPKVKPEKKLKEKKPAKPKVHKEEKPEHKAKTKAEKKLKEKKPAKQEAVKPEVMEETEVAPQQEAAQEVKPSQAAPTTSPKSAYLPQTTDVRKIFALGKSAGASYYHLMNLCDRAKEAPFSQLQREYSEAFQNLNVMDIVLEDIGLQGKASQDLNKVRLDFYNALNGQDLNETKLAFARDMFVVFYENLIQDVNRTYVKEGNWLLTLGFYTSFQNESLNSDREDKILLSGFGKILNSRPIAVPKDVYGELEVIDRLDKINVTQSDLEALKTNIAGVMRYFSNYSEAGLKADEVSSLIGVWQGILINPESEKSDIRLNVAEDKTAVLSISGIAEDIPVSDIRIVNNYFTFMFKPFGTEKLYLRFNAKLSENMFSGEITDVLGEKGYWVLAQADEKGALNDNKLDMMTSYIRQIEDRLRTTQIAPVN